MLQPSMHRQLRRVPGRAPGHAAAAARQQRQQQQQQRHHVRLHQHQQHYHQQQRRQPPVRLAAAAAAADVQQLQPEAGAAADGGFSWTRAWWPVAIISQLDPARPTATELLGRQLVVWHSPKTGEWVAFEDRCPHRMAPLSEGRLEPSTGNLMCSYHGWQFDADGSCTAIPQIGEPAAAATACASKRTCATAYPTQVAQGLLWVWPDAGSAAEAARTPPATTEQWGSSDWTLLGGEWMSRDMAYGFDTLMENLYDPSHIPFAHHSIMGPATRDKATPLEIDTTQDVTPTGGFKLARSTAPFKTADPTDTVNLFKPPCLNCSVQTNARTGKSLVLSFYGVPLRPGRSRVITAFFTNSKLPPVARALTSAFEWIFHLGQNQVLDSDAMLLHVQERLLHEGRERDWRSAFYLPARADTGIIKWRNWLDLAGPLPWPPGLASALGPPAPREQVLDRFNQHVKGCKACSAALKWIQRLQVATLALAGLAAAAAVATTASVLAAGAGGPGLAAALRAAAPAALLAGALAVGHVLLKGLGQRFIFRDYVHALVP